MTSTHEATIPHQGEWARGYLQGHEAGSAAASITADLIRQLQAQAWDDGYQTGRRAGHDQARAETAAIVADLAHQSADLNNTLTHIGRARRDQRITDLTTDMEATAATQHAKHGTTEWAGLDNGAALPSADWDGYDTTELHEKARQARAVAPNPALTTWADVRAYVDDRTWNRILTDLTAATRNQVIHTIRPSHTEAA